MACLDTSFLIALIRRELAAERKLESLIASEQTICTTPITACELYAGACRSSRSDMEIKKVREILARVELLEFSSQACERFGRIRSELEAAGSLIGDFDIMISSIAMTHDQSVVTRDVDHFEKVAGLTVQTW